jgi:hypothetical protein
MRRRDSSGGRRICSLLHRNLVVIISACCPIPSRLILVAMLQIVEEISRGLCENVPLSSVIKSAMWSCLW